MSVRVEFWESLGEALSQTFVVGGMMGKQEKTIVNLWGLSSKCKAYIYSINAYKEGKYTFISFLKPYFSFRLVDRH